MAPDFSKQFNLYVDASDIGLGAVPLQDRKMWMFKTCLLLFEEV